MSFNKKIFGLSVVLFILFGIFMGNDNASAFTVSPMAQKVVLTPGESYSGIVKVSVPADGSTSDLEYDASVAAFTMEDSAAGYAANMESSNEYSDIVNWVKLSDSDETVDYGESLTGVVGVGKTIELKYTINTPGNARGGGHYFAVWIKSKAPEIERNGGVGISDSIAIASLVYAETPGDITVSGAISNNDFPGFYLSPPLTASFAVENTGNTHADVIHYLQVYPLFSDEEIYTNEEDPAMDIVLPGTSRYVSQTWENTPAVGIFKVRQTVYYDSLDNEPNVTEKIVIICPVWLLFLIIFIVAALVIWIVMRVRAHGKRGEKKPEKKSEE